MCAKPSSALSHFIRLQVLTRHDTVRPSGRPPKITWPFSNPLSSSLSLMPGGAALHTLARHRSSDAQENELLPVSAVFRYGWVGVSKHQRTERRRDDRGVCPGWPSIIFSQDPPVSVVVARFLSGMKV